MCEIFLHQAFSYKSCDEASVLLEDFRSRLYQSPAPKFTRLRLSQSSSLFHDLTNFSGAGHQNISSMWAWFFHRQRSKHCLRPFVALDRSGIAFEALQKRHAVLALPPCAGILLSHRIIGDSTVIRQRSLITEIRLLPTPHAMRCSRTPRNGSARVRL